MPRVDNMERGSLRAHNEPPTSYPCRLQCRKKKGSWRTTLSVRQGGRRGVELKKPRKSKELVWL